MFQDIQIGADYQASIPEGLSNYGDAPAYENDDRLLWDPNELPQEKGSECCTAVVSFIRKCNM